MPSLDFEVYCGICGEGCCKSTKVTGTVLTITCPTCEDTIFNLEREKEVLEGICILISSLTERMVGWSMFAIVMLVIGGMIGWMDFDKLRQEAK